MALIKCTQQNSYDLAMRQSFIIDSETEHYADFESPKTNEASNVHSNLNSYCVTTTTRKLIGSKQRESTVVSGANVQLNILNSFIHATMSNEC